MDDHVLYDVDTCSRILGFSRSRTYALIKSGVMPSLIIAGSIRVSRRQLMAWRERETRRQAVKR
ncbi:MAG: helix-turn-helix domain-containing protein [Candidatus Limnocylindrales bacterium]